MCIDGGDFNTDLANVKCATAIYTNDLDGPDRVSHLTGCNFIKRMLFSGIY